jgi:hypothetical protein
MYSRKKRCKRKKNKSRFRRRYGGAQVTYTDVKPNPAHASHLAVKNQLDQMKVIK